MHNAAHNAEQALVIDRQNGFDSYVRLSHHGFGDIASVGIKHGGYPFIEKA